MTVLEITDLTVRLAARHAVRPLLSEVSLRVEAGETVGLVGESGSGKSVTCRAALGEFPGGARVGGSVRVLGQEVLTMTARAVRELRSRQAGIVPQDPRASVNPLYRVGSFVTEAMRANLGHDRATARTRAIALLGDVGIEAPERAMRRWPHEFSGGMLQRVVIAAALAGQPALLLADEPTTSLDVTIQAEVLSVLLQATAHRGTGLLLVTHDLELAAAVCDRIYVMYAGRIVERRDAAELFAAPRHPYTAGLLGATPSLDGGSDRLTAIPGLPLGLDEPVRGCAFAARCTHAQGPCVERVPPLVGDARGADACIRSDELGDALDRGARTRGRS